MKTLSISNSDLYTMIGELYVKLQIITGHAAEMDAELSGIVEGYELVKKEQEDAEGQDDNPEPGDESERKEEEAKRPESGPDSREEASNPGPQGRE